MLLLGVAQFVKHGDEGRGACDGAHQQAACTTIGVVWEVRPCEVGLGGKGTFHGICELSYREALGAQRKELRFLDIQRGRRKKKIYTPSADEEKIGKNRIKH